MLHTALFWWYTEIDGGRYAVNQRSYSASFDEYICHVLKTQQATHTHTHTKLQSTTVEIPSFINLNTVCKHFYLLKLNRTCPGLHNVHHPFRRLCHTTGSEFNFLMERVQNKAHFISIFHATCLMVMQWMHEDFGTQNFWDVPYM